MKDLLGQLNPQLRGGGGGGGGEGGFVGPKNPQLLMLFVSCVSDQKLKFPAWELLQGHRTLIADPP